MYNFKIIINMSKLNVKPLADRVLIESEEAETKTASGIYIPDSAQEKPQQGKVVAIGSGTKDIEMELKVGDTVLYGKYSGSEITVDGNDYVNVPYDSAIALCKDRDAMMDVFTISAGYLTTDGERIPNNFTPELSRRARGIDVWAALKHLGRQGFG